MVHINTTKPNIIEVSFATRLEKNLLYLAPICQINGPSPNEQKVDPLISEWLTQLLSVLLPDDACLFVTVLNKRLNGLASSIVLCSMLLRNCCRKWKWIRVLITSSRNCHSFGPITITDDLLLRINGKNITKPTEIQEKVWFLCILYIHFLVKSAGTITSEWRP